MAHTFEEPHANDLTPPPDTISMEFNYTPRGPMITIRSEDTGAQLHFVTDSIPHVVAGLMGAWSAIENDCDDNCDCEEDGTADGME